MSVINNVRHAFESMGRHIIRPVLRSVERQVREHEREIRDLIDNERDGQLDNAELEHRLATEVPELIWTIIREENAKADNRAVGED